MAPDTPAPPLGEPTPAVHPAPNGRPWLGIAVAAFVVGLLVGGLAGALLGGDGDGGDADDRAAVTTTTSTTVDTRRLPASCWTALDEAGYVLDLVERGVTAVSQLEAAQLDQVLDEVETHRPLLMDSIAECREETGL